MRALFNEESDSGIGGSIGYTLAVSVSKSLVRYLKHGFPCNPIALIYLVCLIVKILCNIFLKIRIIFKNNFE